MSSKPTAAPNPLERATRIELAFSAWEADVLPLNYAREGPIVLHTRVESQRVVYEFVGRDVRRANLVVVNSMPR